MKAWELAEDFRAIVAADAEFTGTNLRNGQSEDEPAFPMIAFECETRPVAGSPSYLGFTLTMTAESQAQDSNALAHAALVEKLRGKFFGATPPDWPAARAAVKAALIDRGNFRLLGRGHDAPAEPPPGLEALRFKTPLLICGTVQVL